MTASEGTIRLPSGMTTGIGPLPHYDPGDAIEFVLRHTPALPAVPALPARSRREGMIPQAAMGISGIDVADDGRLDIRHEDLDPEAPVVVDFSSQAHVGLRAFLTAVADRDGPIKLSVTGPVTLGLTLYVTGVDADLAFRIAGRAVRQRARALARYVQERVPQAELVVFVDEPALSHLTDRGFPVAPSDGIDLVSSTLAAVEPLAITGVHCCGPADWRLVLGAGPRMLSLPVGAGAVAHAGSIGDFLDRGGWLVWGAVPTDGPVGTTADRLWRRLSDELFELSDGGCDPGRLRSNAMVTPVCGLARHGSTQAEHVMALTSVLAQRLHGQAIGLRLSVGA